MKTDDRLGSRVNYRTCGEGGVSSAAAAAGGDRSGDMP
jgi:hypothetical protein